MGRKRSGKRLGPWYTLAIVLLRPALVVLTRRDWRGAENLRAEVRADGSQEGIVVCVNHISWFDPLESAHYLFDNGRPPRYLGKESVFRVPFVGRVIRGAGQIPVYRETVDAANSVRDAITAVRAGECVVIYPEGTISRDPGLWPMKGKTGAARVALMSGAPLIPVAQWGAQDVIGPYRKEFRILPRKLMQVRAGEPVDLDDLRGRELDTATLQAATERIMAAITGLLEQIRGEIAPVERFDIKAYRASMAESGGVTGEGEDI